MSGERPFSRIIKRNGRAVPFDASKITDAIVSAGRATGSFDLQEAERMTIQVLSIAQQILTESDPAVEQIQDIVEEVLLSSPYKKAAKAYIIYRDQHAKIREITSRASVKLVDSYLRQDDWKINENSNMSYSLQGLNNYIASEVSKVYWLNKIYDPEIRRAHSSGDIHIHDLGALSVYCVGWDLYDLLVQGFQGAAGKVESSPARHFRSALGQIVNFFYTLQGEAAGAQAFSNFDTLLAPFIRYDNLSYSEVKQSLQEFLFNVNVPTRVGFQTPFTNLTMDLTVPSYFRDQGVIIGGEVREKTYGEFQHEVNLLNRAFLEVMLEGDARGRVFTFPIPTYNISRDFEWDNPDLDLLWDITAKYGIPYFANFMNSDMNPEDARSMCCRLRIDNRELQRRGGGLFGSAPLTGSIGVATINMPRIGYLADDSSGFFQILEERMVMARESLEVKRKVLERYIESDLYPYMKFYLRNIKERFGTFWKNHFATIGLIGMNEACENLLGTDITSQKGKEFALKTLGFMREKLVDFQEETGNNYNLEATPAEGTSHRLALLDREHYPGMSGVKQKHDECAALFYTNSTHPPVQYSDDPFDILDHQDELQVQYTGGTVLHLYIGEQIKDSTALKKFIRFTCEKYRLPYLSITPTFSVCPDCGYQPGEVDQCPACGNRCEVYSRVVGYLRPVNQWNTGKQQEHSIRTTVSL